MDTKIKKSLAVVLSLTLVVGVFSAFAPKQTTKTIMAKPKSVYDEIKLSKLPKKTLDNISKEALKSGNEAAKEVNSIKNKTDYEAALNTAMTSYYKKRDFKQLKKFTATLDNRADKIVENYEKAYKERVKGSDDYEVGEVEVVFDPSVTKAEIKDICKSENAELKKCMKTPAGKYVALIEISLGQTVAMASKEFSDFSFVKAADKNDFYKDTADNMEGPAYDNDVDLEGLTNDPYSYTLHHFRNVNVKGAWDYLREHTHKKIKVAVVDSPCFWKTPDLKNVITDDSYDIAAQRRMKEIDYSNASKHGTAVVGTIAAESNNNQLIAGVASGYDNSVVEVLAISAAYYFNGTYTDTYKSYDLKMAYLYAQQHGAKILNCSHGKRDHDNTTEEVLKDVYEAGVIIVASAGNDSSQDFFTPADLPYVISVGATDQHNARAYFTNYGEEKDILAPGVGVPCLQQQMFEAMSGTSFSAPITTAVAAMMLSVNPDLTAYDVARIMQNTDTKSPDTFIEEGFEHGVLNAEKCVKTAAGYTGNETFEKEEIAFHNIADKADITASSVVEGYPTDNLNDSKIDTPFPIENGEGEITYSFDKAYDVESVHINFGKLSPAPKGTVKVSYSEDGINYTTLEEINRTYSNYTYTSDLANAFNKTVKAKSIKVEFKDFPSNLYLCELQVWGEYTYTRKADACTVDDLPMTVLNLKGKTVGYHKVQLDWGINEKVASKDYEYVIYDDNDEEVARTNDTSCVIENAIDNNGTLEYSVKVLYKGNYSNPKRYTLTNVNWDVYQTTESTTAAPTTEKATAPVLQNLALGKKAVASSEENGGTVAKNAFDGDENTRWSSQWTDDEWIYVDLGYTSYVSKVEIKWETARAASYEVYASLDGNQWIRCKTNNENAESTVDNLEGVYAKYIKIVGLTRNTGYGYSIYEMKVLGYSQGGGTTIAPTTVESTTKIPTTASPTTTETTIAPTTAETTTEAETTTVAPGVRRLITSYDIGTDNLALGDKVKVTTSSNENDSMKGEKACDGSMNTRWASGWTDDEWIQVDLGEVLPVAMLKLHWEAAYGKNYNVLFSLDGEEWYVKKYMTNNTLLNTTEAFLPEYTRYIKIEGKKRATGYGYSLYEMEILPAIPKQEMTSVTPTTAVPTTTIPTTSGMNLTNLALGATGSASSSENDAMGALKAFDGDMNTRWASAWEDNQFIRVNLGAQKYINHIVINWETAYAKSYDIQLSSNGKVWSTKKSITNSDGGIDTVQINDSAMFVRLVCNTRATGYGFSIYEMAVMGY